MTGLRVRHRRTVALDSVDLVLGTGVHGLLGPNGTGKTSLIRLLATVVRPSACRGELLGRDPAGRHALGEVCAQLG